MNLLRLIGSMNPSSGGPCQGIRNSIPELEKLGVRNEVACLDAPDAAFLGMDSFPVYALGPGRYGWAYSASLLPWLLDNLSRFDAVIMHGLWLYPSYAVSKAVRQLKARTGKAPKLYLMPHGMLDPYFQRASGRKLKALRNEVYWKLIESRVVNGAEGVLFTCEEELRLARLPFQPYRPRCEVNVGYGILPPPASTPTMQDAFLARCPGLHDQPYLLFLSRIHEKKGADLLLNAYADLLKANPSLPLPHLVIAGPGLDTAYGQAMQRLVADTPRLREHVVFPGMLVGAAKWGAFYGCEAFVLPSHQENFGIAVAEALACGKPALISDQVNIWREIREADAGFVAADSAEGTQSMLNRWLLASFSEKQAMGQRAHETFERAFSVGPAAFRLNEVLHSERVPVSVSASLST